MQRRQITNMIRRAATVVAQALLSRGGSFLGMIREPNSGDWQKGLESDNLFDLTCFGAVYACNARISGDIAKLELELQRKARGIWEKMPTTAPWWRVLNKPNQYQNRIQFIQFWIICKLLYGNTYVLKLRDDRGVVKELHVLDPRRVVPLITADGAVYYKLAEDSLSKITVGIDIPATEIIHDRSVALWHPLVGVAPIVACAISATQGRMIQANSQKFFKNMSRPSGLLSSAGTITEATSQRMKREWETNYSSGNIGKVAVLGDGLKYEPMGLPPESSQMMQQLGWTVEDVARAYQMPLYKINAGPAPSDTNIEASDIRYYSDCLHLLVESVELCLTEGLELPVGDRVVVCLDGLLRMDTAAQIKMLTEAVKGTIMMPNEARLVRDLPPVAGGSALYAQQQNYSLAALAKRDAREDPFAPPKPPEPPKPSPAPAPDPDAAEEDTEDPEDVQNHLAASLVKGLIDRIKKDGVGEPAQISLVRRQLDALGSIKSVCEES